MSIQKQNAGNIPKANSQSLSNAKSEAQMDEQYKEALEILVQGMKDTLTREQRARPLKPLIMHLLKTGNPEILSVVNAILESDTDDPKETVDVDRNEV